MADGKTHVKYHNLFWFPSLILSLFSSFLFFRHNIFILCLFNAFFILNYWLAENFVSPDLDLISISGQDGRMIGSGKYISNSLGKGYLSKIVGFFVGIPGLLFSQHSSNYSYAMQFFGGHRNFWSHSFIISTIGRIIWFNLLVFIGLGLIYSFGVTVWEWSGTFSYDLFLDIWLLPYLSAQFLAWLISDSIHLFLDTEFWKGYTQNK